MALSERPAARPNNAHTRTVMAHLLQQAGFGHSVAAVRAALVGSHGGRWGGRQGGVPVCEMRPVVLMFTSCRHKPWVTLQGRNEESNGERGTAAMN